MSEHFEKQETQSTEQDLIDMEEIVDMVQKNISDIADEIVELLSETEDFTEDQNNIIRLCATCVLMDRVLGDL